MYSCTAMSTDGTLSQHGSDFKMDQAAHLCRKVKQRFKLETTLKVINFCLVYDAVIAVPRIPYYFHGWVLSLGISQRHKCRVNFDASRGGPVINMITCPGSFAGSISSVGTLVKALIAKDLVRIPSDDDPVASHRKQQDNDIRIYPARCRNNRDSINGWYKNVKAPQSRFCTFMVQQQMHIIHASHVNSQIVSITPLVGRMSRCILYGDI